MVVLSTRLGWFTMRQNLPKRKSTLLWITVVICCVRLSASEEAVGDLLSRQFRERNSEGRSFSEEQTTAGIDNAPFEPDKERKVLSHLFAKLHDENLPKNLAPQRPHGQHPSGKEDDEPASDSGLRHLKKTQSNPLDLGPQRPSGQIPPHTDLGPQRPSGQIPPNDNTRGLTPRDGGISSGINVGQQQLGNRRRRAADIGPHRPAGQHPPSSVNDPQKLVRQHLSPPDIGPQRPNGQFPPLMNDILEPLVNDASLSKVDSEMTSRRNSIGSDESPQRLNGKHPPPADIGPQRPSGQHPPPSDIGPQRPNGQHPPPSDISSQHPPPSDIGPQRPSGQHPPPSDIGPQRPNGQHPPPTDIGPQRPNGQHPPLSDISSQHSPPSDIGPQRPNGQHLPPTDIGPQRPNGQHPPPSDIGPQRPNGQHPPPSDISSQHLPPLDIGPQRPSGQHPPPSDIGPQRPNGQHPPPSDIGPQRPNGQHPPPSDIGPQHPPPSDIGPQRPGGQHRPPSDIGPQRPSGQFPPMLHDVFPPVVSDDASFEPVSEITSVWTSPDGDVGPQRPNGQHPPPSDIGPQRPNGQNSPKMETRTNEDDSTFRSGNRSRREVDQSAHTRALHDTESKKSAGQVLSKENQDVVLASYSTNTGENYDQYNAILNDIEISPYSIFAKENASELERVNDDTAANSILATLHGLYETISRVDPNSALTFDEVWGPRQSDEQYPRRETPTIVLLNAPPVDLGPHRPSGNSDPNGVPSLPSDLGPQRPSGQHPPPGATAVDLSPHRPNGATDPNGLPTMPTDLGPQRPSGQNPPNTRNLKEIIQSDEPVEDFGPHRPNGPIDPNGIPTVPTDLGPQRPSGQNPPIGKTPPNVDLSLHRPNGATDPNGLPIMPTDLGPQRPSGQNPPTTRTLTEIIQSDEPLGDFGPHRPNGPIDPNGIPSMPTDLGPQRPSGQNPPTGKKPATVDLSPHRPNGATDPNGIPPIDLGPQRPAGQNPPTTRTFTEIIQSDEPLGDFGPHRPNGPIDPNGIPPVPTDLGPQRPAGQNPPTSSNTPRVILSDTSTVDFGPHRPNGATDPNGIPTIPTDLGPQRPSGQNPPPGSEPLRGETVHSSSIDLGPHRPTGPTDPNIKPESSEHDSYQESFQVFWNVPTFMCRKHGYKFLNLTEEYGIVQNPDDEFRGARVTILYDPGLFPAVLEDQKGKRVLRNGGVPQEGDLQAHLKALEEAIEEQVPKDFDGLGIIDFEAWRPVWAQNWGTLNVYRTVSLEMEKRRDPSATRKTLESRARARFESAARVYFEATLQLSRELRPLGRWGFYGFPHCFNQVPSRAGDYTCATQHQHQNDKIDWLWKASTALYPSVYLSKGNKTAQDELAFVSGRLSEARRVSRGVPVYAYAWYRYHDTGAFLSEDDLWSSLNVPRKLNLAGTILWGSSFDLNTRAKCARFSEVLEDSLGPAVARVTGRHVARKTEFVETPIVIMAK